MTKSNRSKSNRKRILSSWRNILQLFYPKICAGCKESLLPGEKLICVNCLLDLPFADIHNVENNAVEERLAGKVPFDTATSLCYFQKASTIQSLIHELKYQDNGEVGIYLGEMLGSGLENSKRIKNIDFVIPVPLHPHKLKSRGYNQSDFIAEGICASLNAEPMLDNLVRKTNTQTQTKMSIYDRWQNVSTIFSCNKPAQFENKHLLIVDDVITSGSTIEGCINALKDIPGITISVAVLACAE